MNTKLYIYKLKSPHNEGSSILFSALAENEEIAKSLILNKVINEIYKIELKELFADKNTQPLIYENGDVFIQLLGDVKLFTQ
jgi:hypothetical protein